MELQIEKRSSEHFFSFDFNDIPVVIMKSAFKSTLDRLFSMRYFLNKRTHNIIDLLENTYLHSLLDSPLNNSHVQA